MSTSPTKRFLTGTAAEVIPMIKVGRTPDRQWQAGPITNRIDRALSRTDARKRHADFFGVTGRACGTNECGDITRQLPVECFRHFVV